jgi:hypothetical protein
MRNMKNYLPEFLGVILALLLLNLWYLASLAIELQLIPANYDHFIRLLTTASGAFFGVVLAYQLNKYRDDKLEKRNDLAAINSAFTLTFKRLTILESFRIHMDEHESDFDKIFALKAFKTDITLHHFDDSSLNFMISAGYSKELASFIETGFMFEAAIAQINDRSQVLTDYVYPALKNHGKSFLTIDEIDGILTPMQFQTAKDTTNRMYEHVYKSIPAIVESYDEMLTAAKSIFEPEDELMVLEYNSANKQFKRN